jgi:hypothetical protein
MVCSFFVWVLRSSEYVAGTGLSDGFLPGGVDAQDVRVSFVFLLSTHRYPQSNEFFKQIPYDVLAIGKCAAP